MAVSFVRPVTAAIGRVRPVRDLTTAVGNLTPTVSPCPSGRVHLGPTGRSAVSGVSDARRIDKSIPRSLGEAGVVPGSDGIAAAGADGPATRERHGEQQETPRPGGDF